MNPKRSVFAFIPARFAATRFAGKLMQLLDDKPVIRHTYENVEKTGLFDEVWVVTDDDIIFKEIKGFGGRVAMSVRQHESGSDRIAEAVAGMQVDILVNVQGDEPFVEKESLSALVRTFDDPEVQVASLMHKISLQEEIHNPNIVKVVTDLQNNALYFSRYPIPFNRNPEIEPMFYRHIGVYAYRKNALLNFTQWPLGKLESYERLEQLRYLENGVRIRMVETSFTGVGIDVPEDLEKARIFLSGKISDSR